MSLDSIYHASILVDNTVEQALYTLHLHEFVLFMSSATLPPLSLENAVSPQLHRRLRDRIVSCELAPGQRISETEIAASYEVSRQPVREAFIKLAEENLVSIRPQRGTFIKRISVSAALTARFIRESVEADLVRRVAEIRTPEMITELSSQIEQQQITADAADPAEFMRLDEVFHKLIAKYATAPEVSDYLDGLNLPMTRVRNISAREFSPGKLVSQHASIVEAIKKGSSKSADKAMRNHLREIKKDLPQVVETYPDYFEDTQALDGI